MLSIDAIRDWCSSWFKTNRNNTQMSAPRTSQRVVRSRSLERRFLAERTNIILNVEDSPACIDLTDDRNFETDDVIDLTSPGGNRRSVLTPARGRNRRTNGRNRRRIGHSNSPVRSLEDLENEELPNLYPIRLGRSSPDFGTLTDSDEDLPVSYMTDTNYRPQLDVVASPVGKTTCPVCLDSDKAISQSHRQLSSTICGHVFCDECIKNAIQLNQRCPSCRKALTLKQIHPLFL